MALRLLSLALLAAPTASYLPTASHAAVRAAAAPLVPSRRFALPPLEHAEQLLNAPAPLEHAAQLRAATSYLWHEERTIEDALRFAAAAHHGQLRKSGEPFIIHPIETACILAELRLDCDTVVAGLLHDTVEDTHVTLDDIRERFGESVATLVAGVTDRALVEGESDAHNQVELLQAMSADWRIVLIKLADRLHNMRTLEHMPRKKQQRKARETVQLYVPLARSMGVDEMEHELLRQSTAYLFPTFASRLPPIALALGRSTPSSSLITSELEHALSNHRQAWFAHKAEWACSTC